MSLKQRSNCMCKCVTKPQMLDSINVIIYNFTNNLTNSTLWHVIWLISRIHSDISVTIHNCEIAKRGKHSEVVIECCNCISFCASLHAQNVLIASHIKLQKLLSFLHVQNVMAIRVNCKKILENVEREKM